MADTTTETAEAPTPAVAPDYFANALKALEEKSTPEPTPEAAPPKVEVQEPAAGEDYDTRLQKVIATEATIRKQQLEFESQQREVAEFIEAKKLMEAGDIDGALGKFGLSYEEMTSKFLSGDLGPEADLRKDVEAQIKAQQEKLAALEKTVTDRETSIQENQYLDEVKGALTEGDFKFLGVYEDAAAKVYQESVRLFETTGKVVPIDEVAATLNNGFEEQFKLLQKAMGAAPPPSATPTATPEVKKPPLQAPSPEEARSPSPPEELDMSEAACFSRAMARMPD